MNNSSKKPNKSKMPSKGYTYGEFLAEAKRQGLKLASSPPPADSLSSGNQGMGQPGASSNLQVTFHPQSEPQENIQEYDQLANKISQSLGVTPYQGLLLLLYYLDYVQPGVMSTPPEQELISSLSRLVKSGQVSPEGLEKLYKGKL